MRLRAPPFPYILACHLIVFLLGSLSSHALAWNIPGTSHFTGRFNQGKNLEGSSDLVDLNYHMGPVLSSSPIKLYVIWYGQWNPRHQFAIRDFLNSLSSPAPPFPSVSDWWRTVRLYTDQTGSNVTGQIVLAGEFHDAGRSQGMYLTRMSVQSVIRYAVSHRALPLNYLNGVYLVLTSGEVQVQEFCRAVCGFHYFSFASTVGVTVPYAWVGYSGTQCPNMCSYSENPGRPDAMRAPNGDAGVDGMVSVIAHELAEVSSNPLVNAWYAGDDPSAPTEIADLCQGVYGSGGGGGYLGRVFRDRWGSGFNVHGVNGRKFMVQWVWNPATHSCFGPNAMD